MITVELFDDELVVIVDNEGANVLIDYFQKLIDNKDTHFHLLTPSWGGDELSEETVSPKATLINMIRLQKRKE